MNNNLPSLPLGTNPLKQINQRIIESLETTKRDLEKKLEKLLAFNASSPAIFSEVNAFYSTLAQGLQQANTSFNPSTGTLTIPKGKALDWTKSVKSEVRKKHEAELKQIAKKIPNLSDSDYQMIAQAKKDNPDLKIPKEIGEFFKENGVEYALSVVQDTVLASFEEYLSKELGIIVSASVSSYFSKGIC